MTGYRTTYAGNHMKNAVGGLGEERCTHPG